MSTNEPTDSHAPGEWHDPTLSEADQQESVRDAPAPGGSSQGIADNGARGTASGGASAEDDAGGEDGPAH